MITIQIEGTEAIIAKYTDMPRAVEVAMVRALNRAIASGRTAIASPMASHLGMKVGDIKKAIRLREASQARPQAEIAASLRPIPLSKFKPRGPLPSRGRGRGVTYRSGSISGHLPNAFLAKMKNDKVGVFERKAGSSRKSRGAWSKNLPIEQQMGPSLGSVFAIYRPQGIARVLESFEKNFAHELEFAQGQHG